MDSVLWELKNKALVSVRRGGVRGYAGQRTQGGGAMIGKTGKMPEVAKIFATGKTDIFWRPIASTLSWNRAGLRHRTCVKNMTPIITQVATQRMGKGGKQTVTKDVGCAHVVIVDL